MRIINIEEKKQLMLDMLVEIDTFCREKDIKYFLAGGTLIGAVRHKGFIPWDDDIDIFLPWQDYQKLMKVFQETKRYGILGFGTAEINDFPDPFAKVVDKRTLIDEDIGTVRKVNPLCIDVFPLIGLPEESKERYAFFERYKELNRQIWQEFYATNGRTDLFSLWFPKQKEFLSKYDFDKASHVGVLGTAYGEKDCTTRQVYKETIRMPFEDIEVNVPMGYQEYLDNLYGKDWEKIPEEGKRKTHHNTSFYWNER